MLNSILSNISGITFNEPCLLRECIWQQACRIEIVSHVVSAARISDSIRRIHAYTYVVATGHRS